MVGSRSARKKLLQRPRGSGRLRFGWPRGVRPAVDLGLGECCISLVSPDHRLESSRFSGSAGVLSRTWLKISHSSSVRPIVRPNAARAVPMRTRGSGLVALACSAASAPASSSSPAPFGFQICLSSFMTNLHPGNEAGATALNGSSEQILHFIVHGMLNLLRLFSDIYLHGDVQHPRVLVGHRN